MLKSMSRHLDTIFTDVFSCPASRQEIQLSSFYGDQAKTQSKANMKPAQYPHAFGHTQPAPQLKASTLETATGIIQGGGTTGSNTSQSSNTIVVLPPLRRVVKCSISSGPSTLLIVAFATTNTILCAIIPVSTTPLMGTLWGSFLSIWSLITILQLVLHSVYLCNPVAMVGSFVHLCVVVVSAIAIPRSLFSEWLWVAPCLCTIMVAHQSQLICLVYSHIHNQWIYAVAATLCVMIPMVQLIQIDSTQDDMVFASFVWSIISVYTLYGFAIANAKGAVLVDITVGASPTWQLQE